jgi:hypothetical protein
VERLILPAQRSASDLVASITGPLPIFWLCPFFGKKITLVRNGLGLFAGKSKFSNMRDCCDKCYSLKSPQDHGKADGKPGLALSYATKKIDPAKITNSEIECDTDSLPHRVWGCGVDCELPSVYHEAILAGNVFKQGSR